MHCSSYQILEYDLPGCAYCSTKVRSQRPVYNNWATRRANNSGPQFTSTNRLHRNVHGWFHRRTSSIHQRVERVCRGKAEHRTAVVVVKCELN
ncbi:MAG: hypothetical protein JWQ49_2778 [Edaphobacter sp.]|nr:hypothetical protein [Edaphobacter sp.]